MMLLNKPSTRLVIYAAVSIVFGVTIEIFAFISLVPKDSLHPQPPTAIERFSFTTLAPFSWCMQNLAAGRPDVLVFICLIFAGLLQAILYGFPLFLILHFVDRRLRSPRS